MSLKLIYIIDCHCFTTLIVTVSGPYPYPLGQLHGFVNDLLLEKSRRFWEKEWLIAIPKPLLCISSNCFIRMA
jgi:hypothetical protein